jgi:mannose-6-phosphate isomerase
MLLERHFVEKPWGRTDLPAPFGAPADQRIGEIWYEAPDGAALPILVKWLFTSEKLSIQVHPSDAEARARGLPSGKEECWYIVDAKPGAVLGMGTIRPLDTDELRAASLSGEIEALMDWKPVKPGDYFYIPAGTVHAIGAGITLVEVQQYADITYRLYDYGRPRELHLDDGVAVSKPAPYADSRSGHVTEKRTLVDGPHFWLEHVTSQNELQAMERDGPIWVVPLSGQAIIDGLPVATGQCCIAESAKLMEITEAASALVAGINKN